MLIKTVNHSYRDLNKYMHRPFNTLKNSKGSKHKGPHVTISGMTQEIPKRVNTKDYMLLPRNNVKDGKQQTLHHACKCNTGQQSLIRMSFQRLSTVKILSNVGTQATNATIWGAFTLHILLQGK